MPAKRSADGDPKGPGEPRQFKQTKLSFASASRTHPEKPKAEPEGLEKAPSATTIETGNPGQGPQSVQTDSTQASEKVTAAGSYNKAPTNPPKVSGKEPAATSDAKASPSLTISPTLTPNPLTPAASTSKTTPAIRIRITDKIGDLFAAPPNTLLIHACNCIGSWGGGIALAFRDRYPAAYAVYRAHCARSTPDALLGTALLIPPQTGKGNKGKVNVNKEGQQGNKDTGQGHYVGCLFTSRRVGKGRDAPETILRATVPAMAHLMRLVAEEEGRAGASIAEVRMCRINSGLFAVPWDQSKKAIEGMELMEGEVPQCADGGVVDVVAYERP
ncbi:72d39534-d385-42a5-ad9e-00d6972a9d13 [Thermothielavioides terrestris]|uniref:72d39534-d385-42a5-ad9e-00d6972a9d13 n=1 Tax=Thermothielavioides terrestris TaxID=2587410 RepID=A0A3S4D2B7_9PEZI|nr:72d39534-d385-42a5-ad9e-00d6972a9d13 [Thermothielavioides terrestris]